MKRGQVFDACGGLSIWEESSRKRISGLLIASVFSSSTSFELLYKGGLILLGLRHPPIMDPNLPVLPQALELILPASLSDQYMAPPLSMGFQNRRVGEAGKGLF